ncbi:MAG: VWA domain-containing protein, partial [Desulfovibrionaceae bacterium]
LMDSMRTLAGLIVLLALAVLAAVAVDMCTDRSEAGAAQTRQPAGADGAAGPVTARAELVRDKIALHGDGRFGLRLTLSAPDAPAVAAGPQTPVDLVLVLDRSGSMDGVKLALARRAALSLVDKLGPADRFALVSYADDVTVHGPLRVMDEAGRAAARAEVAGVFAGGGTNLGGGLAHGLALLDQAAEEARPGLPAGAFVPRLGRLVLISDGKANQGVVDPAELGRLAAEGMARGATVSCLGVGLDFNEAALSSLAESGGGSYAFLDDPGRLAGALEAELRHARNVAAAALAVRVALPGDVLLTDAAGYPVRFRDGAAVFHPGDLSVGQTRELFLTFAAAADHEGTYALGGIDIEYLAPDGGRVRGDLARDGSLAVRCVADRAEADASLRRPVWEAEVLRRDWGRLQEDVAADVAAGDPVRARARLASYQGRLADENAAAGSRLVAEHLERDLPALRAEVDRAFAPGAAPRQAERTAKTIQAAGWSLSRDAARP